MDYTNLKARAKSLIQNYGSSLTLQRASYTTFSPTLGSYTSNTTTSYAVYGVVRAPGRMWAGDRYYGSTIIESGDREVVFAVSTTATPDVGDSVLISGVAYRILVCNPVAPGETVLIYKTLCRK